MKTIFWLLALAQMTLCPLAARAEGKTVNLYGWADYFDLSVLDDFKKETGIEVAYDTYAMGDTAGSQLASGAGDYDVLLLPGPLLQREIASGHLQKLDKAKLPHINALSPDIMARLAAYDPGNLYAVNYMWFTWGFSVNAEMIQEIKAENLLASWDVIFRTNALKRFADCGVDVQDSPAELFALALHYQRVDPRSKTLAALKQAAELLSVLRHNVKKFTQPYDVADLATGDACLVLGASHMSRQARSQASAANGSARIGYALPKGGTLLELDNLAIPASAPHRDAAYALIDFLMRPDIAARNAQATHFASGVSAAKAALPLEIANDPSIYPDEASQKSLFTPPLYDPAEQAFINREWAKIKTGK